MQKLRPLLVERLEDRLTPTTSGVAWPDGRHLTLSFVPDGTRVNGYTSNLFATLGAAAPRAVWQQEVLRAFQSWAEHANLNVGLVAEDGRRLGAPGAVQGSPAFGDIRVAAVPLAAGTLATNTPFQWSGTTWSGDVLLNSNYLFATDRRPASYDLFSVMLNEAGNVFGVLDNETDATSAVYHQYAGPRTGLNAGDVADIRTLYGARSADEFDGVNSNATLESAENLGSRPARLNLEADVSFAGDVDFYRFTVPTSKAVAAFTARLRTAGISSLVPKLEVYDEFGRLVGASLSYSPLRGEFTVRVSAPDPGSTYYLRVSDNGLAAFAVGGYRLAVTHEYEDGTTSAPAGVVPPPADDEHTDDAVGEATNLTARKYTLDGRFEYTYRGVVRDAADVDFYKVHAPPSEEGGPQKLNVLVWTTGGGLAPRLEVFDENGNPVPARLLANQRGTYSLEVANTTPGAAYFVKVSALYAPGSRGTGSYFLGVDFGSSEQTEFDSYTSGTLGRFANQRFRTLKVGENSLRQFVLSADAGPQGAWTQTAMEIYNASGRLVYRMAAYSGQPATTGHVYLRAGTYTIRFTAAAPRGVPLRTFSYTLTGRVLSDPIGPLTTEGETPTTTSTTTITTWSPDSAPVLETSVSWWMPYYF